MEESGSPSVPWKLEIGCWLLDIPFLAASGRGLELNPETPEDHDPAPASLLRQDCKLPVARSVFFILDSEMRTTEYTEYTDFEWLLRKPCLTLGRDGAPSRDSVISVHSVHSVVFIFLLRFIASQRRTG